MEDWKREIITLCLVKQRLAEVNKDRKPVWPFHYPENPASREELDLAEALLGFRLDPLYRAYLSHANGWTAFFQRNDLFGTIDLGAGSKHERAIELLMSIDNIEEIVGVAKRDIVPIAVSECDIDVFVITTPSSESPGKVLWLAGGLIDIFPNFDDFFLAMVDYNRREIQRFEGTLTPKDIW